MTATTARASSPFCALSNPAFVKGALRDAFTPAVVNRESFTRPHERDTADHLANQGHANVQARPEMNLDGVKNPDAMVRRDPQDAGTITEFKRPTSSSYNAIRRSVFEAGEQVTAWGGGDVVIDGRDIAITETQARRHCSDAIAEGRRKNKPLPAQIHVILGDGSMITIRGA